MLLSNIVIIF